MSLALDLPIRPPIIVHHMAALDDRAAPPNSLEAICACLDADAAFVEVDITALADSDYLLVHESKLEKETSGHGAVADCTSAYARELFITHRGALTTCRIALLSEVVQLFRDHAGATRLQLDLKNEMPFTSDEPLQRLIRLIEPLGERVLVSSGADWQLRKLHKLAPSLALGFDIMGYLDWQPAHKLYPKHRGAYGYFDDHPLAAARSWTTAAYLADRCETLMSLVPNVNTFYVRHSLLAHSLDDGFNWAEALHRRGIRLDAWTLDMTNAAAVDNARRLFAAGVDQFTTNTPKALARVLEQAPPV